MVKSPSRVKDPSDVTLKMMKVGCTPWISRTQCTSPNYRFPYYAPDIGLRRPTTTSPHEEEYIWPIFRMHEPFTVTKGGTSANSGGTPRLAPAASDQHQGLISTASSQEPLRRTSTINNRIRMSATRHRTSFLQMTMMRKSQSHSETSGTKSTRRTSPT